MTIEDSPIRPDGAFLEVVQTRSGQCVSRCYQCRKCTNGCPLAFAMDLLPSDVMLAIQLGMREEVLRSKTIWVCASCQTCTARCPNDIDVARLMDTLRQLSQESGVAAGEERVVRFHRAFLASVRRHGRAYELGLAARTKLGTRDFLSDAGLGMQMLRRGKLALLPVRIKGRREVRAMFDRKRKG